MLEQEDLFHYTELRREHHYIRDKIRRSVEEIVLKIATLQNFIGVRYGDDNRNPKFFQELPEYKRLMEDGLLYTEFFFTENMLTYDIVETESGDLDPVVEGEFPLFMLFKPLEQITLNDLEQVN